MEIGGEGISHFAFGHGWLVEIVDLTCGDYFFYRDGKEVRPGNSHFGVFYPPFTLVRSCVKNIKGCVRGIGAVKPVSVFPQEPFIFETDFEEDFTGIEQAIGVLDACRSRQSIEINTKPSLLSLRTKCLIDENYLIYPSISRIAGRLQVSHAHLSRQFKRDYGLTPSAYLHQLRVSEATFRLGLGEKIIDISADVGYNDLSRFYKQFRKQTKTSPAECRTILKKRA